jgi:hypothetical protein
VARLAVDEAILLLLRGGAVIPPVAFAGALAGILECYMESTALRTG